MLKNGVNLVKNRQIQPISDFEALVNTGFANGKVSIFGPILSETSKLLQIQIFILLETHWKFVMLRTLSQSHIRAIDVVHCRRFIKLRSYNNQIHRLRVQSFSSRLANKLLDDTEELDPDLIESC